MASLSLRIRIDRILIDQSVTEGLSVSFTTEGNTITKKLPLSNDIEISLNYLSSNIRASFVFNDNEIASGYIAVPEECATATDFEFKDTLVSVLKNLYVENSKFVAEFTVSVHNTGAANKREMDGVQRDVYTTTQSNLGRTNGSSPLRSTYRGTGKLVPHGETSPLRDRINPSHPFHEGKTYKYKEEELHGYLKRIVEHHI